MPFFLSLFLFSFLSWGIEVDVPKLTSPVMDLAGMFSESEAQDLSNFAYELNTNQGPQITVLTVPTLNGFAIEDYSMAVAEKWQLGTKERGNGILVLIAKQERQVRIEVGNGIEGEVTDYDTAKYTRDIFPKYFRNGEFYAAVRVFMEDMAKKFNIQSDVPSPIVRRVAAPRSSSPLSGAFIPFLILFVFINLLLRKRPGARGLMSGFAGAGVGWFLIPGIGLGMVFIFFIVTFLLGLAGISNLFLASSMSGGGGNFRGGGGGWGSGGGGGWGGGGGGFSGGGSSGSW